MSTGQRPRPPSGERRERLGVTFITGSRPGTGPPGGGATWSLAVSSIPAIQQMLELLATRLTTPASASVNALAVGPPSVKASGPCSSVRESDGAPCGLVNLRLAGRAAQMAGDHFQLLPAAGVAAVLPCWGVLQARVVQVRHRAGLAAEWRQPSGAPRQRPPTVTVMAGCCSDGAAPARCSDPPQPVQLRRQRPAAVLQVPQLAVAVERPAVDAARPALPVAGLRGARTGVVGLRPAAAVAAPVEPRPGRDGDLPGPAGLPAGHQLSPPVAWLPGSDQPTTQAGTAQPKPLGTRPRYSRRWGLPGRGDARPARRDRRCGSGADATGACRWTTESNAVPWPWPRGHGCGVSTATLLSGEAGGRSRTTGTAATILPIVVVTPAGPGPTPRRTVRLACRTLPSVPGHHPHDGCLRMRRGRWNHRHVAASARLITPHLEPGRPHVTGSLVG
jgi:hypothetical protein